MAMDRGKPRCIELQYPALLDLAAGSQMTGKALPLPNHYLSISFATSKYHWSLRYVSILPRWALSSPTLELKIESDLSFSCGAPAVELRLSARDAFWPQQCVTTAYVCKDPTMILLLSTFAASYLMHVHMHHAGPTVKATACRWPAAAPPREYHGPHLGQSP